MCVYLSDMSHGTNGQGGRNYRVEEGEVLHLEVVPNSEDPFYQ